jgi:hypothetical protein
MAVNFQKSDIKKAIVSSGGIISVIAKRLKCDWHTANKYILQFELMDSVIAEKESLLDLAESKLLENIKQGDNTAILFYLKTQGKKRGYIEKSAVDVTSDGEKISSPQIVTTLTPAELAEYLKK